MNREAVFKTRFERALDLLHSGDAASARRILCKLADQYPSDPAVFGMLAAAYRKLNDHHEAARCFKKATELSPNSELASLGLYHSLLRCGDVIGAKAEMRRFLARRPSEEYELILAELEELWGTN
jgi:predicted Zn-dependent protease